MFINPTILLLVTRPRFFLLAYSLAPPSFLFPEKEKSFPDILPHAYFPYLDVHLGLLSEEINGGR